MTTVGRTLVLCFDGTRGEFSNQGLILKNTNVVDLFTLLDKNHPEKQLVYYQPGISIYTKPTVLALFQKLAEKLDYYIAWYLDAHILGGYQFLQQSYLPGDKICIFGFSRGAYTARCLAGMVTKIGLIPPNMPEQLGLAYKLYTSEGEENDQLARMFKHAFSRNIVIDFLGVWETVSSVGILCSRTLPFSSSSTHIRKFRQALSCDEHRARWGLKMWTKPGAPEQGDDWASSEEGGERRSETDVLEVWFAGCHLEVGGGAVPNATPYKLSNIPFRWMISEIILADLGIIFRPDELKKFGISVSPFVVFPSTSTSPNPNPNSKVTTPPNSSSGINDKDILDTLVPFKNSLADPRWWLLEFLPLIEKYQDPKDGKWKNRIRVNLFKPRHVEGDVIFHESVRIREEEKKLGYKPKVQYTGVRKWIGTSGVQ